MDTPPTVLCCAFKRPKDNHIWGTAVKCQNPATARWQCKCQGGMVPGWEVLMCDECAANGFRLNSTAFVKVAMLTT